MMPCRNPPPVRTSLTTLYRRREVVVWHIRILSNAADMERQYSLAPRLHINMPTDLIRRQPPKLCRDEVLFAAISLRNQ